MKDLRNYSNFGSIRIILIIFLIDQATGQNYNPPGSSRDLSAFEIVFIVVGGIIFFIAAVYIKIRVRRGCDSLISTNHNTHTIAAPVNTQQVFTGVHQPHRENRITAEPALDSVYIVPTSDAVPVTRQESLPPSYNDLFQGEPNQTTAQSPPDYANGNPRDASALGLKKRQSLLRT